LRSALRPAPAVVDFTRALYDDRGTGRAIAGPLIPRKAGALSLFCCGQSLATAVLAQVPAAPPEPNAWHWLAFGALVVVLLTLDLVVFHRDSHAPTLRESAVWTAVWCSLALLFNGLVWWWRGSTIAIEFLTGYLVEWSLSMDNVFVFSVIFVFFRVPLKYQYRVLFWGILGAIAMRLSFILAGAALLERFHWVMWIFGAFLIYTGVKLAMHSESKVDPERNILMRIAKRFFPIAKENHGERFFVVENGRRCMTPLFVVLLVIESTDVLFAVDSVPAIFGVTKDAFTVFTSNIFAILGLRALYFLLAGAIDLFRYLNYGLSAVLVFVGGKMVGEYFTGGKVISPAASLVVILALLAVSIVASIVAKRRETAAEVSNPGAGY
jgi:tellurite resistance protein TerC